MKNQTILRSDLHARNSFQGERVSRLTRDTLTLDINTSGRDLSKSVSYYAAISFSVYITFELIDLETSVIPIFHMI